MAKKNLKAGMDTVSGFGLKAFSRDELDSIHYATLDVLWNTGVKVESEEAVEIFHGAGARVAQYKDYSVVKIPSYIVEDCIRWAPKSIVLYGRDPEEDYIVEPGRFGFTLFGENVRVNDLYTGENRGCTKKDLADAIRVADALDEIVVIEKCMGAQDKRAETQPLHNYEAMVSNTGKHVFHGFYSIINSRKMVEMAAACIDGMEDFKRRPCVTAVVCPTSPLTLVQQCCDVIIECARLGVGLCSIAMPLCGATSTATLAGTMVAQNAEILSSLVLAQITARATPFIYGSCATIMDLKVGNAALGAPEFGMLSAGMTKMAQYYQIPNWCGSGVSDSKLPDAQAAYEFGLNTMLSALAGCNIIFSCGSIESGMTFDFAKLIMDAEHAGRVQKAVGGIDVTDETIALDVIKEIGPGGEFITHDHTMRYMRNMSQSKLFDRRSRETWMEDTGGKDLTGRAYEKARYILENHKPVPLPDGAAETMKSIIDEYEKELEA